jgi:transposase
LRPSIAKRSGDRVKTDRRDALLLARLARAGELSAVRVPDAADEALRDVVRAREDVVREQRNVRHRLKALLLRNGVLYAGKTAWTAAHQRWLATLKLPHSVQQIALQEYLHAVSDATARAARREQSLCEALPGWSLAPVVSALQALRGIQRIAAITLVAEIQALHRFTNPRQLMAYLGLVASEDSSAARRRLGSITKSGNRAARRLLIEAAHHYRHPARLTAVIARRQADLPGGVTNIAWKAQLRLCARLQRLAARRGPHNKIVVAVARELAGFVWAIARAVSTPPTHTPR